MANTAGIIHAFNKNINGLFKVCREIQGPRKGRSEKLRAIATGFNLYAKCYKLTYKENEDLILEYHVPLFEELLEKLKDTFENFDPEDDSWIRGKDLRIIYGSNRGEKTQKVAIHLSKFYEIGYLQDEKNKDNEEDVDRSGDFLAALIKIFNSCPNRRSLKLEGALLEALNEYDEYEDKSDESSDDDNIAQQVGRAVSQIDNPDLMNTVGGVVGNIMGRFNIPMPTGPITAAAPAEAQSAPKKTNTPYYE